MISLLNKRYIKQILQFEKSFVNNERYNKKQLTDMMDKPTYLIIGFFKDKKLVGYLIANNNDISVDLFKIYVDEKYRNKGIGKQLLTFLINHHRNKPIYVEVLSTNAYAIKLYEKLGFKKIHERSDYYGVNKHAIIMVI
jgi:ribosomal-protein-alanine N-acetyltransferase